jgi:16S rRNA (guanine966-N2)-methyltransferase
VPKARAASQANRSRATKNQEAKNQEAKNQATKNRETGHLMRVVGGKFGGTTLAVPKGRGTRPTSDRTREALFSILSSRPEAQLDGARILDLFAGTGALGLEALSRGGSFCLFVETEAGPRGTIRSNCEACHALGLSKIYRRDATRLGPRPASAGPVFDIVFADPPYGKQMGEAALAALRDGDWVRAGGLVIVEEDKRAGFVAPQGYREKDRRTYGDTQLVFLEVSG